MYTTILRRRTETTSEETRLPVSQSLSSAGRVPATSIREARLVLAPEATRAVSSLCSRAEHSHNDSLLCKIREDVDDLYKW